MDGMFEPCVNCGYCCIKRPCAAGRWNEELSQCAFLTADNKCEKYDEIVKMEKGSRYPMMGSGCSSTLFNSRDDFMVQEEVDQVEPYICPMKNIGQ
jgi:hypothetical protein